LRSLIRATRFARGKRAVQPNRREPQSSSLPTALIHPRSVFCARKRAFHPNRYELQFSSSPIALS
jgi:hypothetical protein